MNAQLGADLAQGPALGVQVGRTLNVHGGHGNHSQPIGLPPNQLLGQGVMNWRPRSRLPVPWLAPVLGSASCCWVLLLFLDLLLFIDLSCFCSSCSSGFAAAPPSGCQARQIKVLLNTHLGDAMSPTAKRLGCRVPHSGQDLPTFSIGSRGAAGLIFTVSDGLARGHQK
jgi:hypothetical protein